MTPFRYWGSYSLLSLFLATLHTTQTFVDSLCRLSRLSIDQSIGDMALRYASGHDGWRQQAGRLEFELQQERRRVTDLRHLLVDNEEQLASTEAQLRHARNSYAEKPTALSEPKIVRLPSNRMKPREPTGKPHSSRQLPHALTTDHPHRECKRLRTQLDDLHSQIAKLTSTTTTPQQDRGLHRRITTLEMQLKACQTSRAQLARQLQAEKSSNLAEDPSMAGYRQKELAFGAVEDDDEEPFA